MVRKLAGIDFPGVTTDDTVSRTAHVSVPAELIDPASGGLAVPGYGTMPPFLHHRTEHGLVDVGAVPGRRAAREHHGAGQPGRKRRPMTPATNCATASQRVLGVDVPLGPPDGRGPAPAAPADRRQHPAGRPLPGRPGAAASATPPTCTPRSAAPGSTWACRTRSTWAGSWPPRCTAGRRPLLDSYEAERRPAAQRVAMYDPGAVGADRPGTEVTALRGLVRRTCSARRDTATRRGAAGRRGHPATTWASDARPRRRAGRRTWCWTPNRAPVRLAELTGTAGRC